MSIVKSRELTPSDNPAEIEGNIRGLVRQQNSAVRQPENSGERASTLMRRLSLESTREIDRLIDDLKNVRGKLEDDGNRVQSAIVGYASLSQSVIQLTKIVSDSMTHVKRVSDAPSISTEALNSMVPTSDEQK
jgi:hypothetical protein